MIAFQKTKRFKTLSDQNLSTQFCRIIASKFNVLVFKTEIFYRLFLFKNVIYYHTVTKADTHSDAFKKDRKKGPPLN